MKKNTKQTKTTRRDFILLTTNSMIAIGLSYAALPIIKTIIPSHNILEDSITEVDLSDILPEQTIIVEWQGKPIFITNRSTAQITKERSVKLSDLIDPVKDADRTKPGHEQWLVTIGICTHLGCIPIPNKGEFNGWLCPCHDSHYDLSGRIRKGPAPFNLPIPPYKFISNSKIRIG